MKLFMLFIWYANGGVDHVLLPDLAACEAARTAFESAVDNHPKHPSHPWAVCVPVEVAK